MSRNNKSATRLAAAKEISAIRKGGGHGPSSTQPKHGKVNRAPRTTARKGAA
jgi:hypothetical protein